MNSTHRIKNIIFDVDGTLLDSKRDIAGAQHWVLQQLGIHDYAPEDLYQYIGKPLAETFTMLLPDHLHGRIPEAAEMYVNHYRPRAFDTTTLFPGVAETLKTLHGRGYRLAVATTKSTPTTERIITHFGIAGYFSQLQGTDNIPYKPDPSILNKILSEQGWEKTETLMVGDTDKDIETGKNAGTTTCGVTYGSLTKEQIQALHPNWIIDAFPELLIILP